MKVKYKGIDGYSKGFEVERNFVSKDKIFIDEKERTIINNKVVCEEKVWEESEITF